MSDTDLIKLYSQKILRLAADIPLTERLQNPDGSASKRAPLCGSVVSVDVGMDNGRIVAFGQDVKACALGQAAASVVGANIIGQTFETVRETRAALANMLENQGPAPQAPFGDLEVLSAASDFRNRHASILLCLDATLSAMDAAAEANCA